MNAVLMCHFYSEDDALLVRQYLIASKALPLAIGKYKVWVRKMHEGNGLLCSHGHYELAVDTSDTYKMAMLRGYANGIVDALHVGRYS